MIVGPTESKISGFVSKSNALALDPIIMLDKCEIDWFKNLDVMLVRLHF